MEEEKVLNNQQGSALPLVTGVVVLMILLGTAAVRFSVEEVRISSLKTRSMEARYFSESLFGIALQWFQEPDRFPGNDKDVLTRRLVDGRGARSFFDSGGISQFGGSRINPDYVFRSESYLGEVFGAGWQSLEESSEIRIFRPEISGALCGIEAVVSLGKKVRHRVGAQLLPSPIPTSTAALQLASMGRRPIPLKVHWGDIWVEGDADLGDSLEAIPLKDSIAPLDGESYGESGRRDRWIDIRVGGRIVNPVPDPACPDCPRLFREEGYPDIYQGEETRNPGWGIDPWDYQSLKQFSKEWGRYFRPDGSGQLLEGDGSGGPLRPIDVFSAGREASEMRLVFIDTLDGLPPNENNLASIRLPVDYIKGIFSVYADLVIDPIGSGKSLDVPSPLAEGGGGETIRLESIHVNGILSVAGKLEIRKDFRLYGLLRVEGGMGGPGEPEIWYNASYESGMIPGLPTVMVKKGTWYFQ